MKQTPRVQQTIQRAEGIATGHGDDFIGTEHVPLALARDPDGIAGRVLDDLGVREEIQVRLKQVLESPEYNSDGHRQE